MSVNALPSAEELRQILNYDPLSGLITWRGGRNVGLEAGTLHSLGRRVIRLRRIDYYAHRVAWKMWYGTEPPALIDHIDRNPLNNAIANLRAADKSLNALNTKNRTAGVSWCSQKSKWRATLGKVNLGFFPDRDAAVSARQKALGGAL